jgi:hypothetical protein
MLYEQSRHVGMKVERILKLEKAQVGGLPIQRRFELIGESRNVDGQTGAIAEVIAECAVGINP